MVMSVIDSLGQFRIYFLPPLGPGCSSCDGVRESMMAEYEPLMNQCSSFSSHFFTSIESSSDQPDNGRGAT